MENGRQLFIIGREVWDTLTYSDTVHTIQDMDKLDLFKPPFQKFDIHIIYSTRNLVSWIYGKDHKGEILGDDIDALKKAYFRYEFKDNYLNERTIARENYKGLAGFYTGDKIIKYFEIGSKEFVDFYKQHYDPLIYKRSLSAYMEDSIKGFRQLELVFLCCLISVLAAKNVVKTTIEIPKLKTISRKRNKKKYLDYDYVTTIEIGKITETMRSEGAAGAPVRPHLRRGHIRNQHYGVGNKEVKQIFIQPVFVNADEGWIENQRKEYRIKL